MKHNSEALKTANAFKFVNNYLEIRLKNLTTPEGEWNKFSEEEKKELNQYVLSLSDDSIEKQAWLEGWRGYGFGGK